MAFDNTFWAFVALVIFIGILIYFGVHKVVASSLDKRIKQISDDLSEAKRLREEAQALLADYERKRKAAESEAAEIVSAAQEEAERMAADAKAALEDLITRRTRAVEDKIAQAEAQALADVRARSADVAVEAARVLLAKQMAEKGDAVIDESIKEVSAKLN